MLICFTFLTLVLCKTGPIFFFSVIQLCDCCCNLASGIRKLCLILCDLLLAICDLLLPIGKLTPGIRKLLPAICKLRLTICQLGLCLCEFRFRFRFPIRKLLLRIGDFLLSVLNFLFGIVNLLLCFALYLRIAQFTPDVLNRLHAFLHFLDFRIIGIRIGDFLFCSFYAQICGMINFGMKRFRQKISKAGHGTIAKRRASTLKCNVARAVTDPAHSEFAVMQRRILFRRNCDCQRITDGISLPFGKCGIQQTFCRLVRQTSLLYGELIYPIRDRLQMQYLLHIAAATIHILHVASDRKRYPLNLRERFDIGICQPECSEHLDIHELILVVIIVSGRAHIRRSRLNPGKKCHAHRHNKKDGKEAVQALPYFGMKFFP